ncbi:hypothetical protein NC651_027371 [Populus alba x Populus x berolinensis]|nr:hypothetical protein NC651_027371 [Populus alba x Populus x berolinensis]
MQEMDPRTDDQPMLTYCGYHRNHAKKTWKIKLIMTLVVHAVPQVTKPLLLCPWQLAATSLRGSSPLTRPLRRPAPRMVNDGCPRDALLHALVLPSLLAEI